MHTLDLLLYVDLGNLPLRLAQFAASEGAHSGVLIPPGTNYAELSQCHSHARVHHPVPSRHVAILARHRRVGHRHRDRGRLRRHDHPAAVPVASRLHKCVSVFLILLACAARPTVARQGHLPVDMLRGWWEFEAQ